MTLLDESKSCICSICHIDIASKTKLFKHLEDVHGLANPNAKPCKCVLLIGWLASSSLASEMDDKWIKEAPLNSSGYDVEAQHFESLLLQAIYKVDNCKGIDETLNVILENPLILERPKGYSRCSSSAQRASYVLGVEDSCHRACDVICYQGRKLNGGPEGELSWIQKVNDLLPENIRILGRYTLPPSAADFHAEMYCSQQVFEYTLPLNAVMPKELAIPPSQPIIRRKKGTNEIQGKMWSEMDEEFPSDTPEGQARISFFRRLKSLLKKFAGKYSFHNFATGGATPEESAAVRKLDRMYHKDLLVSEGENWVVFSVSGDAFLRGQVRKLVGLALAITRGWLPEWYLDVAIKSRTGDSVCDIPSVPKEGLSLAECRYSLWETKHNLWMDPRRELVALQIAATQEANALAAAAAATAALLTAQGTEHNTSMNGDVDITNSCVATGESSSNGEGGAMSVQPPVSVSVPMPLPIAATIITSQGVFTATHNPRAANRINLLNPHTAPTPTPTPFSASAQSSSTATDPSLVIDGRNGDSNRERERDTYSMCASSAVSTEGARVVSNVNIMESWRARIQSHAVRLMNQRGYEWLVELQDKCRVACCKVEALRLLQARSPSTHLHSLSLLLKTEKNITIPPEESALKDHFLADNNTDNAPAAYRKVLRLLREADRSGLWPLSSVARQKVMIAGTEVQLLKVAAAVGKGMGDGDGEETSDTLKSDQISNNNSDSNGNSNRGSSGQGNGQTKKKGKYSHKDNDEKDKEKNPNGTSSDNKKKKRKKYVIYTDNPAVGKVENESIEMASETGLVTEAGAGTGAGTGREIVIEREIGIETGTIISNESVIVNDSMTDENNNSHTIGNANIITTEEMIKIENRQENDSKKSDKMKIEIIEEKMRVEERKKEGIEKLLKESVLNAQREEEEQERNEDEIELSRKGGRGTFSVGCLPKPLNCPKGNTLFPELMRACFELEKAICPHRMPSATIAINRHAQFRPHRDSGAGNGQSSSLIVGLGDYCGGELAVEGVAHDIRYKGLEFDGWSDRHWTLPFEGERYSLVWFTPLGVKQEDLWWNFENNENDAISDII